ncbi:MAG: chain-length determining protein [Prevotella sp.]|nr:chain-length determining protein [Prevotella sp.]
MEESKKQPEVIDLRVVMSKIWKNKKLFYKTLPIAFVLSCIYILSIPRYYTSDVKLAPELDNGISGGTLGDIASSLGFDISTAQTSDAISPLLYPDLMEDNKFVTNLFGIQVATKDGEVKDNYYNYLKKRQKKAWWMYPIGWIKNLFPKDDNGQGAKGELDPYHLSKKDNNLVEKIRDNIKLSIDKKTGVITINVTDQDPIICKTIADTLMTRLQDFITEYRTNKARVDVEYYKKLTAEAKQEYEKARQRYGSYADANMDIVLESYRSKRDDLENDMQLKFNAYSTMNTQLQAAMAKVQERTPAFTVVKGAAVPVKPAGPKRMLFVAGMLILTFIGTAFYLVRKDLHFAF